VRLFNAESDAGTVPLSWLLLSSLQRCGLAWSGLHQRLPCARTACAIGLANARRRECAQQCEAGQCGERRRHGPRELVTVEIPAKMRPGMERPPSAFAVRAQRAQLGEPTREGGRAHSHVRLVNAESDAGTVPLSWLLLKFLQRCGLAWSGLHQRLPCARSALCHRASQRAKAGVRTGF
jgi:hypothetical protein